MEVKKCFIEFGEYTRPGTKKADITGIVLHWFGNVGAGVYNHARWFNAIRDRGAGANGGGFASYHYGVEGDLVAQYMPDIEVAYHAGPSTRTNSEIRDRLGGLPNWRTIGIAMAHPNLKSINPETLETTAHLVAYLSAKYGFLTDVIIRHYDCTGKLCPEPLCHSKPWREFLERVAYIDGVIEDA